MPEVKVYMRPAATVALVGPINAYKVGDEVEVPARAPRTTDGADPGSPAFTGVVRALEQDGLARVIAHPKEES